MELVNFIKTEVKTTIQGIDVVILTEYVKSPNAYTCNVSAQIPPLEDGDVEKWFNVNCILNVDSRSVQVNTSENVPVGFLVSLETEMLAAHELVMSGLNAK